MFEYSLQLGDTKEIEIGDNILETDKGLLTLYSAVIKSANTTTQLNAQKWFEELDVRGASYNDPDGIYDRQVEIEQNISLSLSFEDNETIMRIKLYDTGSALFYGDNNGNYVFQEASQGQTQISKNSLIGKDIVFYKNVINKVAYDINEDVASCDYKGDLMMIIHNPQEEDFDGNDLLIKVNYYKLN